MLGRAGVLVVAVVALTLSSAAPAPAASRYTSAPYTVSWGVRIRGPVDVEAVGRALTRIVGRHEILRTTFVERDGEPVQVVHPREPVELPLVEAGSEEEALALFRRESRTSRSAPRATAVSAQRST